MHPLQVKSEIGPLKKVMVHRPGKEIANLTLNGSATCCLTTFLGCLPSGTIFCCSLSRPWS